MYAAQAEIFDENGIYDFDILKKSIKPGPIRTSIIDYLRLAERFTKNSLDSFYFDFAEELIDIEPYLEGEDEAEKTEKVFELCQKHSDQIAIAIDRMRQKYDKPFAKLPKNSIFSTIISSREYQKPEPIRFAEGLCKQLRISIPKAFSSDPPKDEQDFNNFIDAFISQNRDTYEREYPSIKFAFARTVPDHSFNDVDILIESKYIRGKTSPSKVTSGISEDLTKYPDDKLKLFIVYDPERRIIDDLKFASAFEEKRNCKIEIIR
jgi:hypothetical protein